MLVFIILDPPLESIGNYFWKYFAPSSKFKEVLFQKREVIASVMKFLVKPKMLNVFLKLAHKQPES